MYAKKAILEDLKKMKLKEGDTVFLRISYKAIGKIEGGPKSFLDAILEVIGKEGTILLTAFPNRYINKLRLLHRKDASDINERPKPNTGAMSVTAMSYPNACVSNRIDFPFVAIGRHASYLTENHTYENNGYWILEEAIDKYNCLCLRIGGEPFIGTTHMSLSHVLHDLGEYQMTPRYGLYERNGNKLIWRENNNVFFCPSAFKTFLSEFKDQIVVSEGTIGDGYAIITDMKKSMRIEENLLKQDINKILCNNPDCWLCRSAYSFSGSSKTSFMLNQIRRSMQGKTKLTKSRIKTLCEMYFLSTKNQ